MNGAYLGVDIGPLAFQPTEFAKLCIVVFLASYLTEHGDMLVVGARRVLGVTIPPLKHFGPLLVVWGAAMVMLVFIRDLGSSLMFFGAFLALLYVATGRASFVIAGLALFLAGAWFFAGTVGHVQERIDIWLDPWQDPNDSGFQIAQSLFAQADGGLFGQGFGQALLELPGGAQIPPAPDTDLIYAVITNEVGLFGAAGVVITYLLFAERGFRVAVMSEDGFSKLLATGLTAVFALQAFVIVGGVTRVIPLTGRDAAVRQLRRQLDRRQLRAAGAAADGLRAGARAPRGRAQPGGGADLEHDNSRAIQRRCQAVNARIRNLFGLVVLLFAVLIGFTSYWSVFDADELEANPANKRPLLEEQQIRRGLIVAARRHGARPQPRRRATRRASTSACIRRATCSATRWVTASWSVAESGLEREYNDDLTGKHDEFETIFDELRGREREGDDVVTTLDPRRAAHGDRWRLRGARARSSRSSRRRAGSARWSSVPGYDPNSIPDRFADLRRAPGSPLLNRTVQSGYPPGSTFKVVTATAALDSGRFTPQSVVDGKSPKEIGGVPLTNFGNEDFGPDHAHRRAHELRQHGLGDGRRRGSARGRCTSTCGATGSTASR